jgi:predicted SnoaL-like aldol condensation-catalyzing enzyme
VGLYQKKSKIQELNFEPDGVNMSSKIKTVKGTREFYPELDVFRVDDETGLINEHWDSSERWGSAGRPPGAEFFP